MSSDNYPLKHLRLEQLSQAGFNVADFVCFPPRSLKGRTDELRAFLAKHGRISCRHFHEDEKKYFKCPVKYDQTDIDVILAFCLEHNETYYTLCNEAINLQESVCAGNILTLDDRNYFVEYFHGPGTPRDIESKGADELKVYTRSFGSPSQGPHPPDIVKEMAYLASKFRPILGPYILEFSVYPYPIGKNQSEIIIWEWRLGWLHYQLQANKFLLTENQRLLLENQLLRAQLEEAHATANGMHDEMVATGVRQETFGV